MMRTILLKLSESPRMARWVTRNSISRRVSRRFVAGEDLNHAIAAARTCNQAGLQVSLDYLGENAANEADARRARDSYLATFDRIAAEKLDANVSLKLTQLGMDLSEGLCQELLESIVERAASHGNFVRIDMEGSPYTQRTVDMCKRVRARSAAVGVVVQAYLFRTEKDVEGLLAAGSRLRLCKGAYKEPASIAFPEKKDVDANFVKVMKMILPSGIYHGIATHDPAMIAATKEFGAQQGITKDKFEFQMLYGIRSDLQQQLVREGYRMRIYIPYGQDWFPYFMRRLAERPANLTFFLKSLFR
ncbi:MAG: proline dehydrogenase family protein [Acidobacteria bacterium]|nr:proline dehydrogenase family protein [Acidobacteriota bacterium]